jgi:hypothetical protein
MLGRIKFDLKSLVIEMLDQIPDEVFQSSTTTFLDPCMAGGQFVYQIENRLREYGHSDENISQRVFGFESNILAVRFAVNKYKLVGQYRVQDFIEWKTTMRLDVIIGNPPYQIGNQILWKNFVDSSITLLKAGSCLVFVTPNSWASGSRGSIYTSLFQPLDLVYVDMYANRFFPGIGKDIGHWMLRNKPREKNTSIFFDSDHNEHQIDVTQYRFFIRKFNILSLSIFKKVQDTNCFWSEFTERKTRGPREFAFPKIRFNGGYQYGYKYDGVCKNFPNSPVLIVVDMDNYTQSQTENLFALFDSNLYRFLWFIYGASDAGSFGWILRNMPKVDLTRTWTDQELYEHFGLTEEEIDYIEASVK